MVTQCPACGSRFRITGHQLGRAGGRVRCGACLEIFLARDSLSGDAETAPDAAELRQPGGQGADDRKGAGKGRSGAGEPRLARGGPGTGRWVRWALVVAVLILFLQIALHLT